MSFSKTKISSMNSFHLLNSVNLRQILAKLLIKITLNKEISGYNQLLFKIKLLYSQMILVGELILNLT